MSVAVGYHTIGGQCVTTLHQPVGTVLSCPALHGVCNGLTLQACNKQATKDNAVQTSDSTGFYNALEFLPSSCPYKARADSQASSLPVSILMDVFHAVNATQRHSPLTRGTGVVLLIGTITVKRFPVLILVFYKPLEPPIHLLFIKGWGCCAVLAKICR
jgi:hypothetical protein